MFSDSDFVVFTDDVLNIGDLILWFCKLRGFANQFTFTATGCFRVAGALLPVLIGLWLVHSSLQAGGTRIGTFQ